MKTLLYTQEYPPFKGGVANYYEHLAKNWPAGEEIFVLPKKCSGRIWQYFCQFYHLFRAIRKNRIDYILVGQILPLGSLVHALWRLKRIKYAVFLHGMDLTFAFRHPRKAWIAKHILRDASQIICANSYTANLLKKNWPTLAAKTIIVNPGVSEYKEAEQAVPEQRERLRRQYFEQLENKTILLSLGRLVKRKGFDSVLAVLKDLPADLAAKIVYVIIGQGPEEERLRALATNQVIFVGAATEAEKWAWLELADIFIMPARDLRDLDGDFEGFGIVYLEANLCGRPVIAGASGGVSDAVVDGLNGLLVDPDNLGEIRDAIIKLASDKELRAKLGRQGQERAQTKFNWTHQAKDVFAGIKNN
ncbi:MAG: glycosyltransferase family 4 protein [Candidatus Falkowbacteria bacterium]|nr:glycosyltransferase family 4 protein [Candidatus Falkowbacteria bacterium]